MNQSHYYTITDKIIKNILILTLHINFINCATSSNNNDTQMDYTQDYPWDLSVNSTQFPFRNSENKSENSLRTSYNSHENSNEDSMEVKDNESPNDSTMEHSGTECNNNSLQATEQSQSTNCLPNENNGVHAISSENKNNDCAISSDNSSSKKQDEDGQKDFESGNNVNETKANPPTQTDQTNNDHVKEMETFNLSKLEIDELIKIKGTFLDFKNVFISTGKRKSSYIKYFSRKDCNIDKTQKFLIQKFNAELNENNEIIKIRVDSNSWNALTKLESDFMSTNDNSDNIVLNHNFAILCHLFKFYPKIATIIEENLSFAKEIDDFILFKTKLIQYALENKLLKEKDISDDPDRTEIISFIDSISRSSVYCLKNLLNFTNLFLGLLRLHYYGKLATDKDKKDFMNYFLPKGNVETSGDGKYCYKLPWVYPLETDSAIRTAQSNPEGKCDH